MKIVLDEEVNLEYSENVFCYNILKSVMEYHNLSFFESLPSYHVKNNKIHFGVEIKECPVTCNR